MSRAFEQATPSLVNMCTSVVRAEPVSMDLTSPHENLVTNEGGSSVTRGCRGASVLPKIRFIRRSVPGKLVLLIRGMYEDTFREKDRDEPPKQPPAAETSGIGFCQPGPNGWACRHNPPCPVNSDRRPQKNGQCSPGKWRNPLWSIRQVGGAFGCVGWHSVLHSARLNVFAGPDRNLSRFLRTLPDNAASLACDAGLAMMSA
jgi:hypothetical protein